MSKKVSNIPNTPSGLEKTRASAEEAESDGCIYTIKHLNFALFVCDSYIIVHDK